MPEDMPDRIPKDMSDRMPEGFLPVTKRINVMVGMTRSKVIFVLLLFCVFLCVGFLCFFLFALLVCF
jgi:hypothetical protein